MEILFQSKAGNEQIVYLSQAPRIGDKIKIDLDGLKTDGIVKDIVWRITNTEACCVVVIGEKDGHKL